MGASKYIHNSVVEIMTEPAPSTRVRVSLAKLENLTKGRCPTQIGDSWYNASLFTELIKDLDGLLTKEDNIEEFNHAKSRRSEIMKAFEDEFVKDCFNRVFGYSSGKEYPLRFEILLDKLKTMKWLSPSAVSR